MGRFLTLNEPSRPGPRTAFLPRKSNVRSVPSASSSSRWSRSCEKARLAAGSIDCFRVDGGVSSDMERTVVGSP